MAARAWCKANRALELRVPTMLRRILMRLRGVRTLVPEGTLMCRTHTTQHELSAIAPNFQSVQLFASLGFADIRVGATSADILVEVVRTCTHARMHAASCAACTQAPAALKPSRVFAYAACPPARPFRSRTPRPCSPRTGSAPDGTWHSAIMGRSDQGRRCSGWGVEVHCSTAIGPTPCVRGTRQRGSSLHTK